MLIPTDERIRALHEKYAPTRKAYELVYTHCQIVCRIAEQVLARTGLGLDAELIRVGSLLHDIGVYRLYDSDGELDHAQYVRHWVLGADLLGEEGFPEAIRRFCSRHTGVGLSRDDVEKQGLPLPIADYLAESGEEKLVMYADKFHSKTDPPTFVTAASYEASVSRFGADKATTFKRMCENFGAPDLARGHKNINTTMAYKATYPTEAIEAHRAFIARRRATRPSEEYRTPTSDEWDSFLAHFEKRKLSVGIWARAFGAPCIHEHACVRCSMLRVSLEERPRLIEMRDNLLARIAEAEREGWLGEVEGLRVSLAGAEDKLSQVNSENTRQREAVLLGIPTFAQIAARTEPAEDRGARSTELSGQPH